MTVLRDRHTCVLMPFVAMALAVFSIGCGSITQPGLTDHQPENMPSSPAGHGVPVIIGNVTASVEQPAEVREAVCRYLRDVITAEVARHGAFILVDTNATSDLLSSFGIDAGQDKQEAVSPEATLDVKVLRLEEKLGATVKIGFVSSQKKHAIVELKATLRSLTGGQHLESTREGKSSKGAWGVITSVNREAMKGGQKEWELDGSMIGVACANALRAAVDDLNKQARFRANVLGTSIDRRFLRPRTKTDRY